MPAEIRNYNHLFDNADPDKTSEGKTFLDFINPDSLEIVNARVEPYVAEKQPGYFCQFERTGYFCVDPDSKYDSLVFNRTVTLRDSWAKMQKK